MELKSYPVSQRYEQYEQRAQRLAAKIHWIRRHFILLLIAAAVVFGLLFWFLSSIGTITKPLQFDDFIYGEQVEPSCHAFLCRPKYEYREENSDLWSEEMPFFPGTYQIRAYTKGFLGKIRYCDVLTFTISKRSVLLSIPDSTYYYGNMSEALIIDHIKIQGLAAGDHLSDAKVSIQQQEDGKVYAQLISYTLENESEISVNDCYQVQLSGGSFTMVPRPITVSTNHEQKEYDAQIWQGGSATVTAGSLVSGDMLEYTISELPADAGVYEIDASCRIINESGLDVTHLYDLKLNRGKLTVNPIKLTITTGSAAKTYDGKNLSCKEWKLTDGRVIEGHKLYVATTTTRKAKGESLNEASIRIEDASRRDVTQNYDITVIYGTLKIDPILLKVQTGSATKVYDGETLTMPGKLTEGAVLKGHKITISTIYGQKAVGTCSNTPSVVIRDKNGVDVTEEGYSIEYDIGLLTVTPRPITVTSDSAQKLYDGMPLTCHKYAITEGSLGKWSGKETVSLANFSGQQTEVGSSDNVFNIFISSSNGYDTTSNYDITYVFGTLTVLENPDFKEPETESKFEEKPGGDTPITFPRGDGDDMTIALIESLKNVQDGKTIYLRFQSYGDYTLTGWTAGKPISGYINDQSPLKWLGQGIHSYGNTATRIRLTRLEGCGVLIPNYTYDVNSQFYNGNDCYFHDSSEEMVLDIYPYWDTDLFESVGFYDNYLPEIAQMETEYRELVYQKYLTIPESTRKQLLQWAMEHGIDADSYTLIEDIQQAVLSSATYNLEADPYPAGVDVVVHFLTEAQEGICQHFASAATLLYRTFGIPARYTVGYAPTVKGSGITEVTTGSAHAWVEIYIDGYGWTSIEATPGGANGAADVEIQIAGYPATKFYDGQPFDLNNIHSYRLEGGFIRKGHHMEVTYKDVSQYVQPGTYKLEVQSYRVYDEAGNDVTDLYDISFNPGTLTILPRPITIVTGSSSKQYDGMPLSCLDYWIGTGSLAPGHRLTVELANTITEPGQIANEIKKLKIVDSRGKDVGKYYNITVECGNLIILP